MYLKNFIGFCCLTIFIDTFPTSGFAQALITGRVADQDQKPISFANIGILNKGIGTLSEENGKFSLLVGKDNMADTLTFSSLGFQKKTFLVADLRDKDNLIVMEEQVTILAEVVINAKKIKPKITELGNKFWQGPYGVTFVDTLYAGAAMALLIKSPYQPTYPTKAKLRIQKNSLGNAKIRLRLLGVNTQGLPGEDLLHESVVVETKKENDWLDVDLAPYKLKIDAGFFLVFEWITTREDGVLLEKRFHAYANAHPDGFRKVTKVVDGKTITEVEHDFHEGLLFGASSHPFSLEHYSCFYRTSSLAPWQKSLYIMAARITVSDTPK